MIIHDYDTSDFFTVKDHLICHALLIPCGSLFFSILLALQANDGPDGILSVILFGFIMGAFVTTFLMIPYSILTLILHLIFNFRFSITLGIHIVFTIILTILMMSAMGIAVLGGIAFGISGYIILSKRFSKKVEEIRITSNKDVREESI